MSSHQVNYYYSDEDPLEPQHERLVAVEVRATPEPSPDTVKAKPVSPALARTRKNAKRLKNQPSPGDTFLLHYLAPNHPDIAKKAATTSIVVESDEESGDCDSDSDMEDIDTMIARQMEEKELLRLEEEVRRKEEEKARVEREKREAEERKQLEEFERLEKEQEEKAREAREQEERLREEKDREIAVQMAAAALGNMPSPTPTRKDSSEHSDHTAPYSNGFSPEIRPEQASPQGLGLDNHLFKVPIYDRKSQKSIKPEEAAPSPHEIRRTSYVNGHPMESLVTSPLGPHMKHTADSPLDKLPAMQSPCSPDGPASPANQKLPSFSQIDQIATQASENIRRFSVSAPSPTTSFPHGPVRSPYACHPSPSILSETSPRSALSPQSVITGQFLFRRPSQASDIAPALHSASTTDSSYASGDAYSPSTNPTPQSDTHRMSIDGAVNGTPILPPPIPSMTPLPIHTVPAHGSGGFQCDFTGCTAAPFQTQYLLNSHANVHSQIRPHYCPVPGCPRSEGGKGFKRKNEMIRHGLVHDSPGYVCPFCPDREHKYPRPDNLQRHVRVHHMDKNKDDPLLRDVLAQRPETSGGAKGRRRRLGS